VSGSSTRLLERAASRLMAHSQHSRRSGTSGGRASVLTMAANPTRTNGAIFVTASVDKVPDEEKK